MQKYTISLPTGLTLIRLLASLLILPLLIVYVLPYNHPALNACVALIFIGLSFTDFLDGYYARKLNQASRLGAALDHIADKFLTNSTLIALLAIHKIYFYWVILFVGRDLFIMGLRQIALENNFTLPVDYLGKVKTACMMILLSWIILNPYQHQSSTAPFWHQTELIFLTISLLLTILSAYTYFRFFKQRLHNSSLLENEKK
jgi:CDP-diacylglycerol--glycerol-3-phosphate 3-phosphatidyltransferase